MRKVIVNSTPLIVLSGVGRLDLLKKLYGEVIIPKAVYREVTAKKDSVCMQVIGESDWIHVEKIRDRSEKKMYKAKLHDGEVEVMILAQENNILKLYHSLSQNNSLKDVFWLIFFVFYGGNF